LRIVKTLWDEIRAYRKGAP